jgi:hypothetical protein
MKYITEQTENFLTWTSKVKEAHFPIVEKLTKFYFLTQYLAIDRFNMILQLPKYLKTYIICFADGSATFSATVLYLVNWDMKNDKYKCQMITSRSRIQTIHKTDPLISVPKNEVCAATLGSEILLQITSLCQSLHICGRHLYNSGHEPPSLAI